jgi:hypothetical protein
MVPQAAIRASNASTQILTQWFRKEPERKFIMKKDAARRMTVGSALLDWPETKDGSPASRY